MKHIKSILQEIFNKNLRNQDFIIALLLFILGIVTRVPFASRLLSDSDSTRFGLAMIEYDVAQMRPHAPGYILYVAFAKLIDLFVHDARVSLVCVSIVSGAFITAILYFLGKEMYGKWTGIISSLLLLTSPLFWFNNEMPLTYSLEGLFCIIFVFSCYKVILKEKGWLFPSAVMLGLTGGVRQHIVIMLLPLWLYAFKGYSIKKIILAFLFFGTVCLCWIAPMVMLTGGIQKYFSAVSGQFNTWVLNPSPFLFQIKTRGTILATYMIFSLGLGIIPIIYFIGRFVRISNIVKDSNIKLLLLSVLPAIFFFIIVNIWNLGHVVFILPPLFVIIAESLRAISRDLEELARKFISEKSSIALKLLKRMVPYKATLSISAIILLTINTCIFLFDDTRVSYAAIKKNEAHLSELLRMTKHTFVPEKTIILTCHLSTQAAFYLPDYLIYCPLPLIFNTSDVPESIQNVYISFHHQTSPKTFWIPTDFKIEPLEIPDGIDTVILWEDEIAQFYESSGEQLEMIKSDFYNINIFYRKLRPTEKIYYNYHYFTIM